MGGWGVGREAFCTSLGSAWQRLYVKVTEKHQLPSIEHLPDAPCWSWVLSSPGHNPVRWLWVL